MIECPRCGFIQPEDRYCANCGVDIPHFKPKPRHWSAKLLSSFLFQAGSSLVIILALIYYLFRTQAADIESRYGVLENSAVVAASTSPLPSADVAQEVPAVVPVAAQAEVLDADVNSVLPDPDPSPSFSASTSAVVAVSTKIPEFVDALFYEVPHDLIAATLQDAQSVSVLPTLQIFNLANEDKLRNLAASARRLPGSTEKIGLKEPVSGRLQFIFPPTAISNGVYGLRLEVGLPNRPTGETTRFSTRIAGHLLGLQKGNESQSLSVEMDEVVISSIEQPIAILGLVPNNLSMPAQPADLSKTPFAALGSMNFQQSLDEVLLILQFE